MTQHLLSGRWQEIEESTNTLRVIGACQSLHADDGQLTITTTLRVALDSIEEGEGGLIARAVKSALGTLEEAWDLSEEAVTEAQTERDAARAELASLRAQIVALCTVATPANDSQAGEKAA